MTAAERALASRLGAAVRARRLALGLTLEALGRRVTVGKPYLSHIENARRLPSLGTLLRLAAALGCEAGELL